MAGIPGRGGGGCPPGTYPAGPYPASSFGTPPVMVNAGAAAAQVLPIPVDRIQAASPFARNELDKVATRVIMAAGALSERITHPTFQFFEQIWRRLPEQGIHSTTVTPERPISIPMGAFRVPKQQALLLFDLRPDIYTFSGLDPNDWVPVEERRFSGQIGWDVTVDGTRQANTYYELQPLPRQSNQVGLGDVSTPDPGTLAPASAFAAARANAFGASLGAGTALQPQRHQRYGPESLPLTLWVKEGQTFTASAGVFRRIMSPIAFFEFGLAGILMPANLAADIFEEIQPSTKPRST
jgi:hypothetical protein